MQARSVLLLVLALVALAFSPACSCDGDRSPIADAGDDAGTQEDAGQDASEPEPDAEVDAGEPDAAVLDIFEAWQQAREALQASPDHLPARAQALIEEGDPEKLFELVRDEIMTYPPSASSFEGAADATRWGVRGTLRGGAGTPREKAELLAFLLTEAGFTAEVVHGAPDPERIDGMKVLLRPIARSFAPAISDDDAAAWRVALGQAAPNMPQQRSVIDPDGAQAEALAAALLEQLPADLEAAFDFAITDMPLVRVTIDDEPVYANPLVADAQWGESLTLEEPTSAGVPGPTQTVYVRLEASRANEPFERFTLVEHEYQAEEVVGRRIHLGFRPPLPTAELVRARTDSVEALLPILTVDAPELDDEARDELAVIGKAVSFGGDVYELDGDSVLINGAALGDATTDPDEIARVETVGAVAEPAAFPRVTLRVRALDADGEGVKQLGAGAFTVTEDGEPVSFSVTRNAAPPPRVAILFDISSSVPAEFLGAGAVLVAQDILSGLYAASSDASVRLGVISFGAQWMGPWVSSLSEANTQALELETASGGSEIWNALRDARAEQPTLVIMVTDGAASEPALPEDRDAVAAGAPVLTLGVGGVVQETLDEISALSGGRSATVATQAAAVAEAVDAIEDSLLDDYTITYSSDEDGADSRTVAVTVNDVTAEASYDVPAEPVTPPVLAGLYLTVRSNGHEITRSVAGFASGYTTATVPVSAEMIADVRSLLFGRISIAVEAAAPAASVVLDEWLREKLGIRALYEAAQAGDEGAVLAAIEQGFTLTPPKLPLAQPPLRNASTEDALTFETGLRIASMVQKTAASGTITRQLDLFPLSVWATAAEDPRDAFERTLAATASLAVMEAGLLTGTSTFEALEDETLTLVAPGEARNQDGLTSEQQLQWAALEDSYGPSYSLLVPRVPGPFWAIDRTTGTIVGVLADGSGGATEDGCGTADTLNTFLQLFSLLGDFFEVGEFGPWVALAQWEIKYVTIATIVISGGTPMGDTGLSNPAEDMSCSMMDGVIGDAIPGLGTYEAIVDTLDTVGMDTGLPTPCGSDDGPC